MLSWLLVSIVRIWEDYQSRDRLLVEQMRSVVLGGERVNGD